MIERNHRAMITRGPKMLSRSTIKVVFVWFALSAVSCDTGYAKCNERSKVTLKQFRNEIAKDEWIGKYTVEFGATTAFAKTHNRWFPNGNGGFRRETVSYDVDDKKCSTFGFNYEASSDLFGARLSQVDGPRVEQFVSQDVGKYFWWYICITPNDTGCARGFFDLVVRDTRKGNVTGELDLNGLPLNQIVQDLKSTLGLTFDKEEVRYAWLGEECFFQD